MSTPMIATSPIKKSNFRFIEGKFLRGPIPMNWVLKAARTGSKSLELGIYIWYLAGIKKTDEFPINLGKIGNEFALSRRSMQRALKALEHAGLLKVDHQPGKKNKIKIVEIGNQYEQQSTRP